MKEIHARSLSGIPVLLGLLLAGAADAAYFLSAIGSHSPLGAGLAVVIGIVLFVCLFGLYVVEPNQTAVLSLFGRYVGTGEINSTVEDQASVVAAIEQEYAGQPGVTLDHLDGLTVAHADWWFNVRASNTEPLLRLNVEAPDEVGVRGELVAIG